MLERVCAAVGEHRAAVDGGGLGVAEQRRRAGLVGGLERLERRAAASRSGEPAVEVSASVGVELDDAVGVARRRSVVGTDGGHSPTVT